jgi:hypothetical protein
MKSLQDILDSDYAPLKLSVFRQMGKQAFHISSQIASITTLTPAEEARAENEPELLRRRILEMLKGAEKLIQEQIEFVERKG